MATQAVIAHRKAEAIKSLDEHFKTSVFNGFGGVRDADMRLVLQLEELVKSIAKKSSKAEAKPAAKPEPKEEAEAIESKPATKKKRGRK